MGRRVSTKSYRLVCNRILKVFINKSPFPIAPLIFTELTLTLGEGLGESLIEDELWEVNEHFSGECNAENGHYGQTLFIPLDSPE